MKLTSQARGHEPPIALNPTVPRDGFWLVHRGACSDAQIKFADHTALRRGDFAGCIRKRIPNHDRAGQPQPQL
jgi:hypothetical protein